LSHSTRLLMKEFVTHDVTAFFLTRPEGFSFEPGQAVSLAIDAEGLRDEPRPFSPTSLPDDELLQLVIKRYEKHDGVTEALHDLDPGARLLISDAFGTIEYRGPGTFIAAGAGITPFLPILRSLAKQDRLGGHSLLFSNKTPADVICERELRAHLGDRCHFTCTRRGDGLHEERRIDRTYLGEVIDDLDQQFYICGPPSFVKDVRAALSELGTDSSGLVFEGA
jgi:cytochrome-b5 reductase